MACVTMARARSAACSRASLSSRLTRPADSRLASASICLINRLSRFVGGQSGEQLEVLALARDELFVARGTGRHLLFASAQGLFAAGEGAVAVLDGEVLLGQHGFAFREHLFDATDLLPVIARVLLGLDAQLVRAFLRFEQGLFAARIVLALRLPQHPGRLFFRTSHGFGGDALAVGEPVAKYGCRTHERDDEVEGVVEDLARHEESSHRTGPLSGLMARREDRGCRTLHDGSD